MKITFLGAVEEVTGSRYLVEHKGLKVLVDCGLFQGAQEIKQRNWQPFPLDPSSIDAIVITHAHIDHTGYIPLIVKNDFKGKIYCSKGTYALSSLLLIDSASLQEEAAQYNNAEPLYTVRDAEYALRFFVPIDYDKVVSIGQSLLLTIISSHHILGASFVILSDGKRKLTFSGDLGRPHTLIMKDPPPVKETDFLVLESTYGDRLHEQGDPIQELGKVIRETVNKGGILLIPSFAVGRTQTILYCLYQLKQNNSIPDIPIYLDSPLAIAATQLLCQFDAEHKLGSLCEQVMNIAQYTPSVEESKHLNRINGSAIIIAGSGMADGGRVMHHIKHLIDDAHSTILFVGFQATGTLGYKIIQGTDDVKIQGSWYPVRAQIKTINSLSAHADYKEILAWLTSFEKAPQKVFITHGEVEAALSLKKNIEQHFGWSVVIPKYLETFDLDYV